MAPACRLPCLQTLSTGAYTLVDVRCRACRVVLGWQYLAAESPEQKYKEGAVLLQQGSLTRINTLQALSLPPPPMHL